MMSANDIPRHRQGGSFRITLSIPAELRERMRPYDKEVNWSAVAAQAFEHTITLLAEPPNTGPD